VVLIDKNTAQPSTAGHLVTTFLGTNSLSVLMCCKAVNQPTVASFSMMIAGLTTY